MVKISSYAEYQLESLISRYTGFRTAREYGPSAFQYWLYQVRNHIFSLDAVCEQECEYGVYEMPYWGQVVYSCYFADEECMVYVHEFKFNKHNFNAWLKHQELKEQKIIQIVNEVINKLKRLI